MADVRLIDANALMKNIGKIPQLRGITYGRMKKAVEETSTIDAVPVVHGYWIANNICSVCWKGIIGWAIQNGYKFCPHCGAKMDAKEG